MDRINVSELNGTYRISTISNQETPMDKRSNGLTTIQNGHTQRIDDAGCAWTMEIRPICNKTVEFISMADPTQAVADFCLTGQNGKLTREPVTFKAILKVDRIGDKIRMSGQMDNGGASAIITMIKVE